MPDDINYRCFEAIQTYCIGQCCGDVVSVSCFRTAVSGARPRDFVVLPACRSLHNSAGFQCVITRRKPHED
ncbi:hypothetical protein NQZ68_008981 [Dissostichus eleginoides]|nr:hypothetical protein NQZ68_008981 [Dissostichus eleginoides]